MIRDPQKNRKLGIYLTLEANKYTLKIEKCAMGISIKKFSMIGQAEPVI